MITEQQVEPYRIILEMAVRTVITLAVLVAWLACVGFMLWKPELFRGIASSAGFISFGMKAVFEYYFPHRDRSRGLPKDPAEGKGKKAGTTKGPQKGAGGPENTH